MCMGCYVVLTHGTRRVSDQFCVPGDVEEPCNVKLFRMEHKDLASKHSLHRALPTDTSYVLCLPALSDSDTPFNAIHASILIPCHLAQVVAVVLNWHGHCTRVLCRSIEPCLNPDRALHH
jgi:hypothetical protein